MLDSTASSGAGIRNGTKRAEANSGARIPTRPALSPPSGRTANVGEVRAMAKGQMRSNKEAKKPKQAKAKAPVAVSTTATRLNESQERTKGKK